jgi:hypothetical protein
VSEVGVRVVLVVAVATSLGLGAASAWVLVRWFGKAVLWVFAVPATMWWLVAALTVAVHGLGVRVAVPTLERSASAPGGPLTSGSSVDAVAQ